MKQKKNGCNSIIFQKVVNARLKYAPFHPFHESITIDFFRKVNKRKKNGEQKKYFAFKSIVEPYWVQLLVYQVCIVSTFYFCILYQLVYRMAGIENES